MKALIALCMSAILILLSPNLAANNTSKHTPTDIETLDTSAITALDILLSVEDMQQDIDAWHDFVTQTHPDLAIRIADTALFEQNIQRIRDELTTPLSVKTFLAKLSVLNGQFHDAHMSIMVKSQKTLAKQLVESGKALFPFEVTVKQGDVFIRSALGGQASPYQNAQLLSINGAPIKAIYNTLLARTYGDTVRHKEALLSNKFALFYWLLVKPTEEFRIELMHNNQVVKLTSQGSTSLPLAMHTLSFDETFQFEILDNKQALLTINEFWWQDKQAFYDFTAGVFSALKAQQIEHLIIDIRNNPGGDDDMWKTGLLRYIANKPYQHTSRYTKKVLAKHQDEGEQVGDVVTKNYTKFETVDPNEPLHFNGQVSVVVGALTYSSAILFANTMQDFGFANVIGERSGGYAWQTGGIQFFTLPHSGLRAISPRFYLEKPSGKGKGEVIIPDISIMDNPLEPAHTIKQLAAQSTEVKL